MFTGIVQEVGTVTAVTHKPNATSFTLQLPLRYCQGLEIGASVANNGVCLTVVSYKFIFQGKEYSALELEQLRSDQEQKDQYQQITSDTYALVDFDMISTTLALTNLGQIEVGSKLNIERSFRVGSEVGGHILSGHIDNKLEIVNLIDHDNIYQLEFALPAEYKAYVLDKGFVGIDGMSLTVSSITERGFTVNLIPETLAKTTIGSKKVGDFINLEIDHQTKTIVNTVQNYLRTHGITQP